MGDVIKNVNDEGTEVEEATGSESNEAAPKTSTSDPNEAAATGSDSDGGNRQSETNTKSERTFTQDEVSRMMAKEKKQGRNSVYNELGINPNDRRMVKIIKSLVATQKEEDESGDGETVDVKLQEAERRAAVAELKADILAQNISSKYLDDALALVTAHLEANEELEKDEAILDIKKKYPDWFTDTGTEEEQKAKLGTGTSVSAMMSEAAKSEKEQASFGKRLAASRKNSHKSNFSYFGKSK